MMPDTPLVPAFPNFETSRVQYMSYSHPVVQFRRVNAFQLKSRLYVSFTMILRPLRYSIEGKVELQTASLLSHVLKLQNLLNRLLEDHIQLKSSWWRILGPGDADLARLLALSLLPEKQQ